MPFMQTGNTEAYCMNMWQAHECSLKSVHLQDHPEIIQSKTILQCFFSSMHILLLTHSQAVFILCIELLFWHCIFLRKMLCTRKKTNNNDINLIIVPLLCFYSVLNYLFDTASFWEKCYVQERKLIIMTSTSLLYHFYEDGKKTDAGNKLPSFTFIEFKQFL